MTDIVKAIDIENTYMNARINREYPFHLTEKICECGFDSLEQYFTEKASYQFNQLDFILKESCPSECIDEFFDMMNQKQIGVVFIDSPETFVFSGESKPYNEEYCKKHNIPVYPLHTPGGAIVSAEGDFSLGICIPKYIDVDISFFLDGFKCILEKSMENVEIDNNDILCGGRKICGSVMYNVNDMKLFAAHFSFRDNSELITNICGVSRSVKIPSYIEGMTVESFKEEVSKWLRV